MTVKDMVSKMIDRSTYYIMLQCGGLTILQADGESIFWNDSNTFTEAEVDSFEVLYGECIRISIKGFKSINVQENWTIPEPARSWMFDDFEDLPDSSDVMGSDEI